MNKHTEFESWIAAIINYDSWNYGEVANSKVLDSKLMLAGYDLFRRMIGLLKDR